MSEAGQGSDLRVPVASLPAQVWLAGGTALDGRIFVPATAPHHEGPTRPEEWVNEPDRFFPFLPDGAERPVLLNKASVLAISVPAWADEPDPDAVVEAPRRAVTIECRDVSFAGTLVLDMPSYRGRVLDLLNLPVEFFRVREGDRHHLVNKRHITRVSEERSG